MDPSAPVQGDYPVYALRSDRGVYGYLEYLRTLQGVRSAWLFGDELHVTLTSNREEDGVWQGLREQGDESMEWSPVMSSIEDRFMELLQGAEVNPGISPEMQR
jgi:hypothetical protein